MQVWQLIGMLIFAAFVMFVSYIDEPEFKEARKNKRQYVSVRLEDCEQSMNICNISLCRDALGKRCDYFQLPFAISETDTGNIEAIPN
jgi:hypothetical protein